MMNINKTCKQCGDSKGLSEFYKDTHSKDGHRGACKECEQDAVLTVMLEAASIYEGMEQIDYDLKMLEADPVAFDKMIMES